MSDRPQFGDWRLEVEAAESRKQYYKLLRDSLPVLTYPRHEIVRITPELVAKRITLAEQRRHDSSADGVAVEPE